MNQTAPAFPLVGVLTIVFVVLKLTNVIAWSWWWVLSPLWISAGLGLLAVLGFLAFVFVRTLRERR